MSTSFHALLISRRVHSSQGRVGVEGLNRKDEDEVFVELQSLPSDQHQTIDVR